MKNSFEEWVQEIAEGASNREIAMKAGIPMTTFHRKWTKGEFTAEDAVTIARAYGRNPIEALVEQGTLTPDEVHNAGVHPIEEFTMLELAERVIRLTGSKSEIVFNPLPSDDPKQRKPDISLATRRLGSWSPSVGLERGLQKTIEYFKETLGN